MPIPDLKCLGAAGVRQLEFGEISLLGLSAAKPKHSQCWVCSLKGSCSCHEALLIRELRELHILRKTKIGKTPDLRMVTPCSPPSSSWGHFITSLGGVTAVLGCGPQLQPGWAGTATVTVTAAWQCPSSPAALLQPRVGKEGWGFHVQGQLCVPVLCLRCLIFLSVPAVCSIPGSPCSHSSPAAWAR